MNAPGSLTADEVYAASAYILYMNDIIDADAVLDRESLPKVVMPARDRFVMDNRTGGPQIR
jgi:cytochrome c